jgi:hypothetical protein
MKWTLTERDAAVRAYLEAGTYVGASAICGVPWQTIAFWRNSCAEWWDNAEKHANRAYSEKSGAKMRKALDLALDCMVERLEKGDQLASGEFMPVKARDVAVIGGILMDKLKLDLSGGATAAERQSQAERMESYRKLAEEAEARGKAN